VKSQFFKPPRETKTGLKNQIVQEIGGKIKLQSVAYLGEGNDFWIGKFRKLSVSTLAYQ